MHAAPVDGPQTKHTKLTACVSVGPICLTWTALRVQEPAAARNIAFCIGQLALSDKALRRLADAWKCYHAALADEAVLAHFQVQGSVCSRFRSCAYVARVFVGREACTPTSAFAGS